MKILAVCGSGLGSSFMLEMNIKKVLKKLGKEAEVNHSDLSSVTPDVADLFVLTKDLAGSAQSIPNEKLIVLNSIIDLNDLENKLHDYFNK